MAVNRLWKISNYSKNLLNLSNLVLITRVRVCQALYSQWAPAFVEPVYKKEQQQELVENGQMKSLSNLPIKSTKADQTCSVFHDHLVRKFTNHIMRKGKKELARELLEKTFELIKKKQLKKYYNEQDEEKRKEIMINPPDILHEAIKNCTPVLELTPVKRGGIRYMVPIPAVESRALFLSIKWILEAARDKEKKIHLPYTLSNELIDAANNTGKVVKRKQEMHRQCEANRAYAHYRWGK